MTALAGIADDGARVPSAAKILSRAAREFSARYEIPVYLVGGSVRDAILKKPIADFDVALAEREDEFARELGRLGFGTPFPLSNAKHELSVWRVAGKGVSADVARFPGKNGILGDLSRRDFTVNAMARDLAERRILDPHGGRRDLRRGIVRAVSEKNLRDDPLRVLRAYRLAATHGWTIARSTREELRRAARLLPRVSPERIEQELSRLLSSRAPSRALAWAAEDGVLAAAFGISGDWRRAASAARLARLERSPFPAGPERMIGRLAALFYRLRVPASEAAESLEKLRFGRQVIRAVLSRLALLAGVFSGADAARCLFEHRREWPTARRFLQRAAEGVSEKRRLANFLKISRKCRFEEAPVDGNDVSRWLGAAPGPAVGRALEEARLRYFRRQWNGRREIRDGLRGDHSSIDPLFGLE